LGSKLRQPKPRRIPRIRPNLDEPRGSERGCKSAANNRELEGHSKLAAEPPPKW